MVGRVVATLPGDEPWTNLSRPCTWVWTSKNSIDIATADCGRDGEVRHVGSIGADLASLDKALCKLISQGHKLQVVYEAGLCGFMIWRRLNVVEAREACCRRPT